MVYVGHGIIRRDAIFFFLAEVSFRVRHGAPPENF